MDVPTFYRKLTNTAKSVDAPKPLIFAFRTIYDKYETSIVFTSPDLLAAKDAKAIAKLTAAYWTYVAAEGDRRETWATTVETWLERNARPPVVRPPSTWALLCCRTGK